MKAILFKEKMFIAVIDGRKTQTRRIIPGKHIIPELDDDETLKDFLVAAHARYKKGETVYLKEPFQIFKQTHDSYYIEYKFFNEFDLKLKPLKWKNKLFMPEKYARYFIRIKDVRVERINDITREDILTEGLERVETKFRNYLDPDNPTYSELQSFKSLWISINGLNSWTSNPWVFVYEFELIK